MTNATVVYGLMCAGQKDQALEAANKMLELHRDNPNLHTLLGQVYGDRGQHKEAVAAWKEAIRLGDDKSRYATVFGQGLR